MPVKAPFVDVDAGVRTRLDESLAVLVDAGATVVRIDLPDTRPIYQLTNIVNKAEAATIHGRWVRERRGD